MDAYSGEGQARRSPACVKEWIEARLGASVVLGLGEMEAPGDARCGGPRISGYGERHTFGEWLLPLTAKRGMSWRTQAVPSACREKVAF
ncbi:MAG: hypothetical protein RBU25_09445, partial [Lentisphaeria bacterium]|nr:hypothetical protein [Lentisphaeria bacterium]